MSIYTTPHSSNSEVFRFNNIQRFTVDPLPNNDKDEANASASFLRQRKWAGTE